MLTRNFKFMAAFIAMLGLAAGLSMPSSAIADEVATTSNADQYPTDQDMENTDDEMHD